MRPINKDGVPLKNGRPKTVSNYRDWRADLIDRIGFYCCFCNMPLNDSPQVEHVIAQDIDPTKALDWDNMLLACGPCNRTKSANPCPPATHYLPQYHNTHLAFTYKPSGTRISGHHSAFLTWAGIPSAQAKAQSTITLCALDRDTTRVLSQATDLRWKYRFECLSFAAIWRKEYDTWGFRTLPGFLQLLKTIVQSKGFWSIWYEKFSDIFEIRQMLVTEFDGTDQNSFDTTTYLPLPRTPLQAGDVI
jgi:hypothetical protein